MKNTLRVAVVHPVREKDEDIENALNYLDEAMAHKPKLVCFPEGYPGPWGEKFLSIPPFLEIKYSSLSEYAAVKAFKEEAKKHGVYIAFGLTEKDGENYYNSYLLMGTDGEIVGKHRKTTPAAFEILGGCHTPLGGNKLDVFKTEYGQVGVLICWEAMFPELSRILALKGAEIILYPTGGKLYELLETWKTIIWARAIENLTYCIFTVNLYGKEKGCAMVAGPEEIIAETYKEGVLVADLDMERLWWLRETDETMDFPKKYKCIPGLLRHRRPELYGPLVGKN